MEKVIKNYLKAILDSWNMDELDALLAQLGMIATALQTKVSSQSMQLLEILNSPYINQDKKYALLCDLAQDAAPLDKRGKNLLNLLVEHSRIALIPVLHERLRLKMSERNKSYRALLYTPEALDRKMLDRIAQSLSKHFNIELNLEERISNKDRILLTIEGLDIEVSFSNERFFKNLKTHILKAI